MKKNYLDERLLKLGGEIKKNEDIAPFFCDVLSKNYAVSCGNMQFDLNDKILIVGDWATPIELTAKCIDDLMDLGYEVVYKPHPRELNNDRLLMIKCEIMNMRNTALEVLLIDKTNKPKCLIGEYSSVLMYSDLYFGVKPICCKSIEEFCGDNLDRKYAKMFKKIFNKTIYFPQNEDDLINYLSEL